MFILPLHDQNTYTTKLRQQKLTQQSPKSLVFMSVSDETDIFNVIVTKEFFLAVMSLRELSESHRKQGTCVRRFPMRDLLIHGQDREQNFTKFFTELCATGTPNTPVRSSLLRCKQRHSNSYPTAVNRRVVGSSPTSGANLLNDLHLL
jgi:hypothetical protein